DHLRRFIEAAPMAIAMFDCDMRFIAASERWLAEYGLNKASLAGRSCYEVFPEIPAYWVEYHQRALAGETLRQEQTPFVGADGTVRWLNWQSWPWRAAGGRIGGIVIVTGAATATVEAARLFNECREELRLSQAIARTGSWRLDVGRKLISISDE